MKKIIWICSYPKSGNTFIRSLLSAYFFSKDGIFSNFDLLKNINNFTDIQNFRELITSTHDKNLLSNFSYIKKEYSNIQKYITTNLIGDFCFLKTHSSNFYSGTTKLIDPNYSLAIIFIVRDPRDVLISFSHHKGQKLETIKNIMLNNLYYSNHLTKYDIPELLGTWKNHYISFNTYKKIPIIKLKYENLITDTSNEFKNILNFLSKLLLIKFDKKKFINTIESTKFNKLQKMENDSGFLEASKYSRFFRKGINLQWKNALNKNQINEFNQQLKNELKENNYEYKF